MLIVQFNSSCCRSTVFDAMFTHDMEENRKSKVDIVDLDGETVHDMIIYIYSGKVGELEGKATGLLSAAEKYDLRELKQMCETSLCENINTENVLGTYFENTNDDYIICPKTSWYLLTCTGLQQ